MPSSRQHPPAVTLLRPPALQQRSLDLSLTLLLTSGALWLALHYGRDAALELPHPAEPWLLRLHGLAAFAALMLAGAYAFGHARIGWQVTRPRRPAGAPQSEPVHMRWRRRSGLALAGSGAGAIVTAYALYYLAPEAVRPTLGWLHAGLGALVAALLWAHRRVAPQVDRTRRG